MRSLTSLVVGVLLIVACDVGPQEPACQLLAGVPAQAADASLDQLVELAQAAQASDTAEIRAIGERISSTLDQRHALENLAPGATVDILELALDDLRRECQDLAPS